MSRSVKLVLLGPAALPVGTGYVVETLVPWGAGVDGTRSGAAFLKRLSLVLEPLSVLLVSLDKLNLLLRLIA